MLRDDRLRRNECVSLVHGFLANRAMLTLLGLRLRQRGYSTEPWGYRNMFCSIMVHAERFAAELRRLDERAGFDQIHLVTHSMGCIIARAALGIYRPRKLGRFVMLAPPNRGSAVATATESIFGGMFRPVAELTTAETSLVNTLPMPEGLEVGVVAAGMDALVSAESTRPHAPHDHVTVPCLHSSLLYRRDAAELVVGFLADGVFPATVPSATRSRSGPAPLTGVAAGDRVDGGRR
jgi:pimeloyl-ACP methyl ester carboxylesterase